MFRTNFCLAWLVLLPAVCGLPAAELDEVIPHRQDKLPNKPFSPAESLAKITVPEGFNVELVASEPDIVNPIAMAFDDRGRIWITESVEYPRQSSGPGRDRVKVLEDADGAGRAEKFTVFSDNLNIPTGVALGYGGVWVLNAPDLLFMREKEGREISREVVVTGFGRTDRHELPNSLTWGPDGWLYGLNGVFNNSRIRSNNGREYSFTCALWRVHPRTREFQVVCEGTSNPYGIAWDTEGSAIVEACHWANDHLFHFVETGYYQRQAGAYPPFTMRLGSITDHGHQKTAYCGLSFFDSDAYPEKFRERIYIGNIHGGCINADRLERDGATYLAKAEPDFLTTNDAWAMPVSLKVGPDGCLYVLDWYDRYHCYQDANRDPGGIDRSMGRLYRVRYQNTPRAPKFDLARETDDRLIQRLASPNIYFRESAQRLLTERMSGEPAPAEAGRADLSAPRGSAASDRSAELHAKLESLVLGNPSSRKARLHGLWALVGSGSLDPKFHEQLLAHKDPAFRAWAVRAAGNSGDVSPHLREMIAALPRDPSPDVQLQVAIASRKITKIDALPVLIDVLAHCTGDKLIPSIVWPNLHPLLDEHSGRLAALVQERTLSPALVLLMPRIIERILASREPEMGAVAQLITLLSAEDVVGTKGCLAVVSSRLGDLNETAATELRASLRPFLEGILGSKPDHPIRLAAQLLAARLRLIELDAAAVRQQFLEASNAEIGRLQALEALIAFKDPALLETLQPVWTGSDTRFLTKVLAILGRVDDVNLADALLAQYPKLAPELQPLAIDLLMQRELWARKLLNAVLEKKLPPGVLNANHLRKIVESNDREALWAVEKAFGKIREERNPEREKVVIEMADFFRQHPGDPHAGQQVFRILCAQCHAIYGEGGTVGPDITSNGRSSFEQLLSNVFDPSLVIGPAYQVTTVVTKDGRNLTGLVTEENDQRLALKMPGEVIETVPRNQIKYTRVSKLSMMPEGIEAFLDKRTLADLFAFLALDNPPGDPQAQLIPGAPSRASENRK
ncbi:MAG: PVC-type heme-binding CxxCH protein [Verrucomicrobiales bacterium]